MGFLYIQTWVISKGKIQEHETSIRKMYEYMKDKYKDWGAKSAPKYYSQRYGPYGARVSILEFDTNDDYHMFFNTLNKDEEGVKLRAKWLEYIDPNTWKAVFWNERIIE